MQSVPKTVKIFLIISLMGQLMGMPGIEAKQPSSVKSAAGHSKSLTTDELKARRAAIENMKDIDATLKADSLKYLDAAIADLNLAAEFNNKAKELSELIKAAPRRLKILRSELKKSFPVLEEVEKQAQKMDTTTLEQQRSQEEAGLAKEKSKLQKWDERLKEEKQTIRQASEKITTAARRLSELQTELLPLSDVAEADTGNFARMLSLKSEAEKLRAEHNLNELRQRSYNLLVELFGMERDVAQKSVEERSTQLNVWQAEVHNRRQQEATHARQSAQDALGPNVTLPKMIQDQFDLNVQLSTELEEITREEAALTAFHDDYQSRLKALETEFITTKRRFELTELSETMGLALRKQRLNLPNADLFVADIRDRERRINEISEKLIDLDEMLRELSSPKALVQRLVGSVSFLSAVDRQSFDVKIQQLIADRIEILEKLKSGYNRIFKLLQDIDFATQSIVTTANDFAELLDRHLLWIRSSKRLSTTDLLNFKHALGWFFGPEAWRQLSQDLSRSFRQRALVWTAGIILALALVLARRRERHKIAEINVRVQQQPLQDSIALTFRALGLTVLLAIVWPYIMAFPSFLLLKLPQLLPHSRAAAGGLLDAAGVLFSLGLVYHICRKNGLAQIHFSWPELARQVLIRNLSWFIPIAVVFGFVVAAVNAVPEIEYGDTLAKFALIGLLTATAIFLARVLNFKGGITSLLIQQKPKSWLTRLRYIWYPLLITVPLVDIYLAVEGYYYSALEIRRLMRLTVALIFCLIVFNDLTLRLLMLARRQLALKKARMAQQLQQKKASGPDVDSTSATTDAEPSPLMKSTIDMGAIDDQTRALLKTAIFIFALFGLWAIWEPVFPALGIFQDIELWSYSRVVDGTPQTVPITLGNIVVSVLVIAVTIVAVRNLPGLFEMILLNRLPMNPGARYAYSTITRYTLTAIGIVIALNTMGLRWSNLQWLVAALGVGLGFGLQEIVANFVSGLIVLFERPFAVGDTVTVGDIHGTVTRIQIRATTILDWDRKELIVPNKEFITGRLINWSLSDSIIRIKIPVGIAYGSNTDLAQQLLLEVARDNSLVLNFPEPQAVFLGFGDSTLNFELRVFIKSIDTWIPMLHDMNMAIDKSFRQAGITIAFPQRDVHLDATSPLEVRVVSEPSGSKSARRSSVASENADN